MDGNKSQEKTYNQKQNNLFLLPPLKTENNQDLIEPNSILTKFIRQKKLSFIRLTEEELKRPIKINLKKINNKDFKLFPKNNLTNKNIFITDNNISKTSNNNNKDKENDSQNNDKIHVIEPYSNRINTIPNELKKKKKKNNYSRLRSYQPIISENWKCKNGLRFSTGSDKINSSQIQNDIDYQYKIINDEYKLLEDNYNFYITRVIPKANYYESFSSLPLNTKINYNKTLEETIGILYILPQLLLLEFYKLISNYSGVKIPNKKLLMEKIIDDEDKNVSYNNILLKQIYEFFDSCYEVYGTLIREVNDMFLKYNAFLNVINCFQKARFNLSYVASASENALINYNNDMKFIRKMRKEKLHTISVDLTVKMRNQFNFVKNPEKQRKIRIENALENKYIDDDADNENKKRNKSHKRKFISFIDSKLINNLMKHFTGKVKNEISTQLINREIDGNHDDDFIVKEKHKVVKIDI